MNGILTPFTLQKFSRSEEERYLFSSIAEICVDTLRSKVHETNIEPGLSDTVNYSSFIVTRLVAQVITNDAKYSNATRINDLDEDVFEGRCQDKPSHRIFTSKERHSDVNSFDIIERWQIELGAAIKTLKAKTQRML